MEDKELIKIVDIIEGSYARKLDAKEISMLKKEVAIFKTAEEFEKEIKFQLLKKVEYFSVAKLHQIIEEWKELDEFKKSLGIESFDELYEN